MRRSQGPKTQPEGVLFLLCKKQTTVLQTAAQASHKLPLTEEGQSVTLPATFPDSGDGFLGKPQGCLLAVPELAQLL